MKIAILLFERITALDAIGPYEVLSRLPGADLVFVGEKTGVVRTDNKRLGLAVDQAVEDVSSADILVVPGGFGEEDVRKRPHMIEWVRAIDAGTRWTTSVCTGSLILGAAGLLRGLRATTHWASLERLRQFGAEPTLERVVEQGKIITAAGVSSGIDMALRLAAKIAGEDVAKAIQLSIEYDPQPPFDCGSPAKAPERIVSMVRAASERARRGSGA